MSADGRIEQARLLYERAILDGEAAALDAADRELDGVEADRDLDGVEADLALDGVAADLALARGRVMHGRFLVQRTEDPERAAEDPRELGLFERAAHSYRERGDLRGEGEALFWIGCCHQVVRRDNAAAVPVLQRSLELATDAGDTRIMAEALRHLGIAEHAAGRLEAARQYLEESTRLRRADGAMASVAANQVGLIYIAAGQGRRQDALALADEAQAIAEAAGAQTIVRQVKEARAAAEPT
jgi:tetratricopeptide (TPR) repeat protein